jgi:ligand-binding SRPBCC domain-containing protein
MAVFETVTILARPVADVFDFLAQPANLVRVSPPELRLRVVDGPQRLHLGARITVEGRRFGLVQRIVSEVTALETNAVIVDEHREGPFRQWVHRRRLEAHASGTRMTDRIEFEAPRGLVGLVLNEAQIERDLQLVFAYRTQKLRELFGGG